MRLILERPMSRAFLMILIVISAAGLWLGVTSSKSSHLDALATGLMLLAAFVIVRAIDVGKKVK